VRTKAKLKAAAEDHMTMIGTSPERVRAYFKDQGQVRRIKTSPGRINKTLVLLLTPCQHACGAAAKKSPGNRRNIFLHTTISPS
jgi:hypothetical protein